MAVDSGVGDGQLMASTPIRRGDRDRKKWVANVVRVAGADGRCSWWLHAPLAHQVRKQKRTKSRSGCRVLFVYYIRVYCQLCLFRNAIQMRTGRRKRGDNSRSCFGNSAHAQRPWGICCRSDTSLINHLHLGSSLSYGSDIYIYTTHHVLSARPIHDIYGYIVILMKSICTNINFRSTIKGKAVPRTGMGSFVKKTHALIN